MNKIAEALLEHETIEGKHVIEIIQFGEMRSPVIVAAPAKIDDKALEKKIVEKPSAAEAIAAAGPTAAPTPA